MHYYELFELEYFVFSSCQSQLPADGVPVTRQRVDRMKQMFDNYIRTRTLENWKFWIVSFDFQPSIVILSLLILTLIMFSCLEMQQCETISIDSFFVIQVLWKNCRSDIQL